MKGGVSPYAVFAVVITVALLSASAAAGTVQEKKHLYLIKKLHPGDIYGMAYNPRKNLVYLTSSNSTLYVINPENYREIKVVNPFHRFQQSTFTSSPVIYDESTDSIYILNTLFGKLFVINAENYQVVKTLNLSNVIPSAHAYMFLNGGLLYIFPTTMPSSGYSVINTKNNSVAGSIPYGALDPEHGTEWVPESNGTGAYFKIVNLASGKEVKEVPIKLNYPMLSWSDMQFVDCSGFMFIYTHYGTAGTGMLLMEYNTSTYKLEGVWNTTSLGFGLYAQFSIDACDSSLHVIYGMFEEPINATSRRVGVFAMNTAGQMVAKRNITTLPFNNNGISINILGVEPHNHELYVSMVNTTTSPYQPPNSSDDVVEIYSFNNQTEPGNNTGLSNTELYIIGGITAIAIIVAAVVIGRKK
ncbi:MAG: hypothetical protein GXO25_06285 [Euryarchaeota archaeon]|nr:hypothetical protein [Euryarchaeota archaeon]